MTTKKKMNTKKIVEAIFVLVPHYFFVVVPICFSARLAWGAHHTEVFALGFQLAEGAPRTNERTG